MKRLSLCKMQYFCFGVGRGAEESIPGRDYVFRGYLVVAGLRWYQISVDSDRAGRESRRLLRVQREAFSAPRLPGDVSIFCNLRE